MIEDIKKILKDDSVHICVGKVLKLYVAEDRSYLKILASIFPEERQIVATMSWEAVGPEAGEFTFPVQEDMVLIAQVEGDDDQAYVIKRLTSRADKIPQAALNGDTVKKTIAGKKYWNISDTRINLSRGDVEPTENVVLGQIFKKFCEDLIEIHKNHAQNDSEHLHMGNLGYLVGESTKKDDLLNRKTEYDTLKQSPISDSKILSDLSFTEK